ncbi:acyltransferase family protein [Aquincola tertiaricarbonis]|uniref:acyltransferase family protein n=1 Tax=Aquincola tertiaricarbonis TaxID=391953 RepID=UPI00061503C6|nr:acyltransferase family protein [Aquincola tertiaricarbonis]
MTPSFSLYLEVVRVVATVVVVLGHAKAFHLPVSQFCDRFHPGRDAVIAFFVLSGFVISWCATERDRDWRRYALQRATRVYSVAVPAVAFSLLVAAVIPMLAGGSLPYPLQKLWLYLPIYLGFLGNVGPLTETPPHNFPWWSLNFEVWYYVVLGVALFGRGRWRWPAVALLLVAMAPAMLALLPVWLAGVVLQRWGGPRWRPPVARLVAGGTVLAYLAVKLGGVDAEMDQRLLGRVETAGHERLLGTYLVAGLMALHLAAVRCLHFAPPPAVAGLIRRAASLTFATYLFHLPLFDLAQALWPRREGGLAHYAAVVAGTLLLCGLAGVVTEQHKQRYRSSLVRLARRLRGWGPEVAPLPAGRPPGPG